MRQAGLFGLSDQLKRLSDCDDPLETMGQVVNFEVFRPALEMALACGSALKREPARVPLTELISLSKSAQGWGPHRRRWGPQHGDSFRY